MDIRSVVWDIDDTLYSREVPFAEAVSSMSFGTDDIHALFLKFLEHGDAEFKLCCQGRITVDEMHIRRIKYALSDAGTEISDADALEFQRRYSLAQRHIQLSPMIRYLLADIRDAGIPMYLITNGIISKQRPKYDALGLKDFIPEDHLLVSEEAGAEKPDPAIFRYAERKWKLEPLTALFTGDSYESDISGARAAGWQTLWLDRGIKKVSDTSCAVHIVYDDSGLCDTLRKLIRL